MPNRDQEITVIEADNTARKKPLTRIFRYFPPVSLLMLAFFIVLGGGFLWFIDRVERLEILDPLPQADAIIVFTGGRDRLDSGVALLQAGKGKRLLISGVNSATSQEDLIRITHADADLFACCIDIGYEALNTIGNARESTHWLDNNHYKTIYIVTNDYHMPRSLALMQHAYKDVTFIPYPVKSYDDQGHPPSRLMRLRLLASEYIKLIGTYLENLF